MHPSVTLRQLGTEDAPVLLAADVFDSPADPAHVARFLGRSDAPDPRHLIVVAETGGQVVGFASAAVLDHPDKPSSLFIIEVGVNEAWRRQGIATALVARLRALGRARGCRTSWVATEADNSPARALYARTGGRETEGVVVYDWDEPSPEDAASEHNPPASASETMR